MRNFSLLVLALLTFSGATTLAQETWLPRTSGVTAHLWGVAYADHQWVTVGEQGTILTSPDPVTWTKRDSGFPSRRFLGIAYAKGLWISVGGTAPLAELPGVIVTSPDGITWTPRVTTGVRFNNVAFGNGCFVALNDVDDVWTSLDGVAWSPGDPGEGAIFAASPTAPRCLSPPA